VTVIFATVTVHPASKPWQIKGFIKLATDERRGGNYPWREFAFNPAAYSGSDIFFFFFRVRRSAETPSRFGEMTFSFHFASLRKVFWR